jgi:SAM-dependent methyltransferase
MGGPPHADPTERQAGDVGDFYQGLHRWPLSVETKVIEKEIGRGGRLSAVREEVGRVFTATRPGAVLDVGGGSGAVLDAVTRSLPFRTRASCDIVMPAPENRVPGIQYFQVASSDLLDTFGPSSFDLVLFLEVIEHLVNPDEALRSIRSILKPGGVLIVTTPNLSSLTSRLSLLAGLMPPAMEASTEVILGRPNAGGSPAGHLRLLTCRALRELVTYHDFQVTRLYAVPGLASTTETYNRMMDLRPERGQAQSRVKDERASGGLIQLFDLLERFSVSLSPTLGSQAVLVATKVPAR